MTVLVNVHLMQLSTRPRRLHARCLTIGETVQFLDTGMQELIDIHDVLVAGTEGRSVEMLMG